MIIFGKEGRYTVTSLYFENRSHQIYFETKNKLDFRQKLIKDFESLANNNLTIISGLPFCMVIKLEISRIEEQVPATYEKSFSG